MASTFTALHHDDQPLVLPNAWDVPSALSFRARGFPAIGTTSFGVAASHGRPDGARATRDLNAALAHALAGLDCPLSLDIEDGDLPGGGFGRGGCRRRRARRSGVPHGVRVSRTAGDAGGIRPPAGLTERRSRLYKHLTRKDP